MLRTGKDVFLQDEDNICYSREELLTLSHNHNTLQLKPDRSTRRRLFYLGILNINKEILRHHNISVRITSSSTSTDRQRKKLGMCKRTIRKSENIKINRSATIKTSCEPCKLIPIILLSNSQSLTNKMNEFELTLRLHQVNVAVVTETWAHEHKLCSQLLTGFKQNAAYRDKKEGGGVTVYVNECYKQTLMHSSITKDTEIVAVKIESKKEIQLVVGVYRPPQGNLDTFEEEVTNIITDLDVTTKPQSITIAGDFNRLDTKNICQTFNLKSLVKFNTRKNARLDDILTNRSGYYLEPVDIGNLGCSDHKTILLKPIVKLNKRTVKKIEIEDTRDHHKLKLWNHLESTDWSTVEAIDDVDEKTNMLYNILKKAKTKCIPVRTITITNKDPEWITPKLKDMLNQKHKAGKKNQRNTVKFLARKIERIAQRRKVDIFNDERLQNSKGSKYWWKLVNKNKIECKSLNKLVESYTTYEEAANTINDFFVDICTSENTDTNWQPQFEDYSPIPDEELPSMTEVNNLLKTTKKSKSGGSFPSWMWCEFADILCRPLHSIYHASLKTRTFPTIWKQDTVTPLPKIKIVKELDELRPITTTEVPSKIFGKIVDRRIKPAICKQIKSDQFAYKDNSSSEVALTMMMHKIHEQVNKEPSTIRILLVDMKKAFDSVEHEVLLKIMEQINEIKPYLPWIWSFLHHRQQRVRIKGHYSAWKTKTRGLPQGTVTGPRFYNLMANNLEPISSNNTYIKFADDMTVLNNISYSQPEDRAQEEINHIEKWAKKSKMKLNPKKTEEIVVQTRRQPLPKPVKTQNREVSRVSSAKILGIYLDKSLTFKDHIEYIRKKSNSKIYILKELKKLGYDKEELKYFYSSVVLPSMTYGYCAWCTVSDTNIEPLHSIQRRAENIIGLKLEDLQLHLDKKISSLFTASQKDSHPLHCLVPEKRGTSRKRSLRNDKHFMTPYARIDLFKRTFLYKACTFLP
jgi:hypothetical protein